MTTTYQGAAGYNHCACHACFELYAGEPGEFCNECEEAGCELDSECCSSDAYGDTDHPEEANL